MDGPRAGCCKAHARPSSKLSMPHGHEGGHFLVPSLNKLGIVAGSLQGAKNSVDSIAGVAINARNSPRSQPLNQKIAYCGGHGMSPSFDVNSSAPGSTDAV